MMSPPLTYAKLGAMLVMQNEMNAKVNPSWAAAGYPWMRAVLIEGGEAMEHHGWKWWKKQEPNVEQFGIELIDIFHFALSDSMLGIGQATVDIDTAIENIVTQLSAPNQCEGIAFDARYYRFADMDTPSRVQLLIGLAAGNRFSFPLFETLMDDVGMSWDELYVGYVAKNVLNFFRQDHGYKEGTYIKNWDHEEDNVRMFQIAGELDADSSTFKADLYAGLKEYYAGVLLRHGRLTESAATLKTSNIEAINKM